VDGPVTRPVEPRAAFPDPVPGSVRRVMHLDYDWTDAVDAVVRGAARDEITRADGTVDVVDETSVEVVTEQGLITTFAATGTSFDPSVFVGHPLRQGFRRRVREVHTDDGSTLSLLLDDLSGAMVAAGYVHAMEWGTEPPDTPDTPDTPVASGPPGHSPPPAAVDAQLRQVDLCSGWRADGTMMVALRAGEPMRFHAVAPVPTLPDGADWPPDPIPVPGLRRHRRIDVRPTGDAWHVDAWFRDIYCNRAGETGALHEYTVDVVVDARDHTLLDVRATPHVLPWDECPAAADAVGQLAGQPVEDLRATVQKTLVGIECCTHLNNELRELADLPVMVERGAR
jgi:hypothetical protein